MKKEFLIILCVIISHLAEGQVDELSDEFNRACSLSEWVNISDTEGWNATHLELLDIDMSNDDRLTMMPYTTAWFANYRSTLMYKNVSGDFVLSSNVFATNRNETGIPSSIYSLAGIMIREGKEMTDASEWIPGEENYIFLSLGFAATNHPTCNGCQGPHFEVKNTTNSNSNLRVSQIPVANAEIRMVRIGSDVLVLYKLPDGEFVVHERYDRTDFSDTMQVGFVTYTDWSKVNTYDEFFHNSHDLNSDLQNDPSSDPNRPFSPDLIGSFDYARFDEVDLTPEQASYDFSNENEVSDQMILDLFSYDSSPDDVEGWKIWKGSTNDWSDGSNWSGGTIPASNDSILIPNCGCPEVVFPELNVGSYTYKSLLVEDGGTLLVPSGAVLNIELDTSFSRLENGGTIYVDGTLNAILITETSLINRGEINIGDGGSINF